jgi:[ribosomal protein S5]-alanine N-acetyltransferase
VNSFPTLKTEHLVLRQPEMTDVPLVCQYLQDRAIADNFYTFPYPYTTAHAEQWVKDAHERAAKGEGYMFAIERKLDRLLIGTTRLYYDADNQRGEIGYWLGTPFWGQGYITESVRRVIQFGFEEFQVNRIYASYFVRNGASRRVMEKAGMTYEGTLRQHSLKNGVYEDWGMCGILRSEYQPPNGA